MYNLNDFNDKCFLLNSNNIKFLSSIGLIETFDINKLKLNDLDDFLNNVIYIEKNKLYLSNKDNLVNKELYQINSENNIEYLNNINPLKNRFIKTKENFDSNPIEIVSTMIAGYQPSKNIFDKVYSIKNINNEFVEFNEINGKYNPLLIDKYYDIGSGYCDNQKLEFKDYNGNPYPNYVLLLNENKKDLSKIYIYNDNFDINLFEDLKYDKLKSLTPDLIVKNFFHSVGIKEYRKDISVEVSKFFDYVRNKFGQEFYDNFKKETKFYSNDFVGFYDQDVINHLLKYAINSTFDLEETNNKTLDLIYNKSNELNININ